MCHNKLRKEFVLLDFCLISIRFGVFVVVLKNFCDYESCKCGLSASFPLANHFNSSPQDIRSFFSANKPKTGSSAPTPAIESKKPSKRVISLSDSDDETPKAKVATKVPSKKEETASKSKKRRVIISSDEDEPKETASKASKPNLKKLKTVDVGGVFGSEPVKRVEKEKKVKPKITDADKSLLETDDIDFADIDESALVVKAEEKTPPEKPKTNNNSPSFKSPQKAKVDEKSLERSTNKSPKKTPPPKERSNSKDVVETPENRKRPKQAESSGKKSTKKPATNEDIDYSVYDPDQERHEKKRQTAALYHKMKNRGGPANPGSKPLPKGKANCLLGLTFVLTGVYESLERDEAADLIKEYGGKVTTSISKKTQYVVFGEESGPAKLAKAEELGTKCLTEDDLLNLIREKSGLPLLKVKTTEVKEEKVKVKVEKDVSSAKKIKKEVESPPVKVKKEVTEVEKKIKTEAGIKKEISSRPVKDAAMQAWVEKYKPKSVKDIIGQQGAASNCEK